MATFAIQFSCFFLLTLSISCQTQARESKFFSKYVHLNANTYVTIPTSTNLKKDVPSSPTPTQAPITSQISGVPASAPIGGDDSGFSPAPAPAPITLGAEYSPVPAPSENEIPYYGLYGKNTNDEEEEFTTENPEELNNNREAYTHNNGDSSNNNGFWTSNHRSYYDTNNGYDFNSGYKSEPQGMSDTRIADNGRYYYNNEHGHKSEPEGMSDTRLVNNGEYYYNVEQENYSPSRREEGYHYGGNYRKSKYEFDSMEEYEKQEGLADVQQDFINP